MGTELEWFPKDHNRNILSSAWWVQRRTCWRAQVVCASTSEDPYGLQAIPHGKTKLMFGVLQRERRATQAGRFPSSIDFSVDCGSVYVFPAAFDASMVQLLAASG